MFRKKKSFVGLDLGTRSLKAVEITMEGSEAVITGFARLEMKQGSNRAEALGALLGAGSFSSRQVVSSVAGQAVVVRYINMVRMSDAELRQAIYFESDKYLPYDIDEVVLDCQRLEHSVAAEGQAGGDDNMSVVLVACQKGIVTRLLDEIAEHGLTPTAVDVDVFALANAWEMSGEAEASSDAIDVATALVDVGASRTQINVMRGGETCFSREIGMGGNDMTKAIARRMSLDLDGAEALKREPAEREVEVVRAINPVLEDLVSELSLSLDFVENREGVRVEEVLLSGGGALAPGAIESVSQGTGRPARNWNPLSGLHVDSDRVDVEELEANAATLAVAVGLAARVKAA